MVELIWDEQIKKYLQQLEGKIQDLTLSFQQIESQLNDKIERYRQAQMAFQKVKQELELLATTDSLTQIPNRHSFEQHLDREWNRLTREKAPISLLLCDVDYFTNYNDTYGYQAGDNCLQMVAQTLQNVVQRPADLVARYGGDEFTIILPNTNLFGAVKIAEKLLIDVARLQISHPGSDNSQIVTISIGVASQTPVRGQSATILLQQAEQALDRAKTEGKNRFVVGA